MAWAGAQRAYHQRRGAKQLQPLNDNDDDEFNAYRATMAGFMEDDLMTIEATAARLTGLANVVSVAIGPEHLHIVAIAPAPFETIANIAGDLRGVDVTVATPVAEEDAERFRENRHLRELYDRDGKHATPGEAKLFAANLGIETPPTLAAIYRGKLGVLFASDADAAAYDRSEAQHEARAR